MQIAVRLFVADVRLHVTHRLRMVRRSKQALGRSDGLLFTLVTLKAMETARLGQILNLL